MLKGKFLIKSLQFQPFRVTYLAPVAFALANSLFQKKKTKFWKIIFALIPLRLCLH